MAEADDHTEYDWICTNMSYDIDYISPSGYYDSTGYVSTSGGITGVTSTSGWTIYTMPYTFTYWQPLHTGVQNKQFQVFITAKCPACGKFFKLSEFEADNYKCGTGTIQCPKCGVSE